MATANHGLKSEAGRAATFVRHLPRFRRAYRELASLEAHERWSRTEIDDYQLARLNMIWQHAVRHVPYYRDLSAAAGLPPAFSSLAEYRASVPVLSKSPVRDHRERFLSEQAQRGKWRHTTGSTGSSTWVYWGQEAHLESLRGRYRLYASWDVDIFDRTVYLWGHGSAYAPGLTGRFVRMREPVLDLLRNRLRLSAYYLSPTTLRSYARRIQRFRPACIYGYSSAVYLLSVEAEAMGFQSDTLRAVFLTAEPAPPYIRTATERAFGVPAAIEYGSIECGLLAGESRDRTLRVREDLAMLETLPRPDGRYDIVVSILNNPSFPLLRYGIGDITDGLLECPAQGFAILRNVAGRNNDLVLSRSGRYLHSAPIDYLFEQSPSIRRYRLKQAADGSLLITIEQRDARIVPNTKYFKQKIQELVEGFPVTVELVDELPRTPAGKHRWIVSDAINQGHDRSDGTAGIHAT